MDNRGVIKENRKLLIKQGFTSQVASFLAMEIDGYPLTLPTKLTIEALGETASKMSAILGESIHVPIVMIAEGGDPGILLFESGDGDEEMLLIMPTQCTEASQKLFVAHAAHELWHANYHTDMDRPKVTELRADLCSALVGEADAAIEEMRKCKAQLEQEIADGLVDANDLDDEHPRYESRIRFLTTFKNLDPKDRKKFIEAILNPPSIDDKKQAWQKKKDTFKANPALEVAHQDALQQKVERIREQNRHR